MSNLDVTLNDRNGRAVRAERVGAGEVVIDQNGYPLLMTTSVSSEGKRIATDLETGQSVFLPAGEFVRPTARARLYVDR